MSIVPYDKAISKWTLHKNAAITMGERLCAAGTAARRMDIWLRGDSMKECSQRIEYTYCPECGSLHLRRTNLCRDRLCPLCAWRLSLQRTGEMMQVIEYLHQKRGSLSAAMLTLTIKNCPAKKLNDTLTQMLRGWDRLMKRRAIQKWVAGYARSIEMTRASNGEYHPHIHVFLLWEAGYNKDISQREWAEMWRQSMQLDYTPIVDIRSAYGKTSDASEWDKLVAASVEATKYAIKGVSLQAIPDSDLISVADALKGRRLLSYGGCIKAARQALKIAADSGEAPADVVDMSIECPKCGCTDTVAMAYNWAQNTDGTTGAYLLAPWPYIV